MRWFLDFFPWWAWLIAAAVPAAIFWPYFMALPRPAKAALLAIGGAFAAYFAGRNRGAKNAADAQKVKDAGAVKARLETENEIRDLGPADVDQRLNRWMRDK